MHEPSMIAKVIYINISYPSLIVHVFLSGWSTPYILSNPSSLYVLSSISTWCAGTANHLGTSNNTDVHIIVLIRCIIT